MKQLTVKIGDSLAWAIVQLGFAKSINEARAKIKNGEVSLIKCV
jgi:hypothetical protein